MFLFIISRTFFHSNQQVCIKKKWEHWDFHILQQVWPAAPGVFDLFETSKLVSFAGREMLASVTYRFSSANDTCRFVGHLGVVAPSDILNPDQRVSAAGMTLTESKPRPAKTIYGSSLQLFIMGAWTSPSLSEYPMEIIPVTGAREDAVLPHTPIQCSCSGLAHLLRFLPASHLLFPPFPALLAALLPDP